MGNPDLSIIIDGEVCIDIDGADYEGVWYDEAIKLAVDRYREHLEEVLEEADFPEEIEESISSIEVYEKKNL